jgi:hypothetical protein
MPGPRLRKLLSWTALAAAMASNAALADGVTSKTLEYRATDITTVSETHTVEIYETRMLGFLAGQPTAIVDVHFALPFSDAAVQAATLMTRQLLSAASADPLAFSGPTLTGSSRTLTDSQSDVVDVLTGEELLWVETVELISAVSTGTLYRFNSADFGCVADIDGYHFNCSEDFGSQFVAAGDTLLLTSAGVVESVRRTTTFTDTYLTASVYEIVGTPEMHRAPEPGSALLAGLAALVGWGVQMQRRRYANLNRPTGVAQVA